MMNFKLDENQLKATQFHLHDKWSYNCMDMGEGKTLTALETARQARVDSVLVYAPAYLIDNWKDEIKKFYGDGFCDFSFASYASTKKHKPADMVIMDEFHYAKNFEAQRTNRIFEYLKRHKPKMFMGLSGTPYKKSALDFYPYFAMLSQKHRIKFPQNPYAFQEVFCRKVENDFTPSGYSFEGVNEDNKEEFKELIRRHFYFTPTHLRPVLPDTMDKKYFAKVPISQQKAMKKADEEGRSTEFMALKSICSEYNAKTTIELAKDLIYKGKTVVIFTDHREPAKIIAEHFKTKPIVGGVSNALRNDLLKNFDNNVSTVLVGTYGAMGMGLNITSSDTMILNDYPFSPDAYDQARKRIHRKGQTKTCFYHHVFSSDLDYQVFNRMINKKEESDDIHGK